MRTVIGIVNEFRTGFTADIKVFSDILLRVKTTNRTGETLLTREETDRGGRGQSSKENFVQNNNEDAATVSSEARRGRHVVASAYACNASRSPAHTLLVFTRKSQTKNIHGLKWNLLCDKVQFFSS
jgi:hypothetical protein